MDIKTIAERIKYLREVLDYSVVQMANRLGIAKEEYIECENGEKDFTFNFLRATAEIFNVDIGELITGEGARLSGYTVDRQGSGLVVYRRSGFDYLQLGSKFKEKTMQTYLVTVPYVKEHSDDEIYTSGHEGQEFNFILEGSIKITVNGRVETLNEGDSIYFDSGNPHGMVAVGGTNAKFLAILVKK